MIHTLNSASGGPGRRYAALAARLEEQRGVLIGLAKDKRFDRMPAVQDELHLLQAELDRLAPHAATPESQDLPPPMNATSPSLLLRPGPNETITTKDAH